MITNCAVVDTGTRPETNPDNNISCTDTYVDPVTPVADVEVTKTGPAMADPGGTITYTLSVTNHGPDAATGVTVFDPLDEPLVTVESLPAGCTEASGTVRCDAGPLAVGETKTFIVTVRVAGGVPAGTQVTDCAQAKSNTTVLRAVRRGPACVQTVITGPKTADLALTKTGPPVAGPGGTYSYTLTATNHGPDPAQDVTVTDATNPSLVTVTSVPAGCAVAGGTVTCDAGTLAVGESRTYVITVQVNAGVTSAVIPNCGQDDTSTHDPDLDNNQACVNTLVNVVNPPSSQIEVGKDGPAVVSPGGTMTYTVKVTNHGPDAAADVTVKDPIKNPFLIEITSLPAGCAVAGGTVTCALGTLAAGETRVLTAEGRVFADLPDGRVIKNCAAVCTTTSDLDLAAFQSCVNTVVSRPFVPVTG